MIELLLLADSRLPSGGHGHSGGVEALVDRGLLRSVDDLALFLEGRVRTGGRVVAAAAAAACALAAGAGAGAGGQRGGRTAVGREQGHPAVIPPPGVADWPRWEAAVAARTPSAALRAASRAQGAALLRTVALAFPTPAVAALRALPRVHHPLVLGAAAAAAGAGPAEAAALALHHLVGGASTAAVRPRSSSASSTPARASSRRRSSASIAPRIISSSTTADEYLKVAERIAALSPGDPALTRELANIYLAKSDTKRALAKLQLCFKADPKDVDTLQLLAQAFRDLGQVSKTISVYKELAHVHEELGRAQEARTVWRKVQELAPDDEEAARGAGGPGSVQPGRAPAPAAAPPAGRPPAAGRAPFSRPASCRAGLLRIRLPARHVRTRHLLPLLQVRTRSPSS